MFENGKLTSRDKMTVNAWFNAKGVKKDCPACGHTSYSIEDRVFQWSPVYHSGPTKTAVLVECHDCGHIRYFDSQLIQSYEEASTH